MRGETFDIFGWGGALYRASAEEDRGPLSGARFSLPRVVDTASFVVTVVVCFGLFHTFKYLALTIAHLIPNFFPEELTRQLPFVLAFGAFRPVFGLARGIISTASRKRDVAPGEFWWTACIVATLSTVFVRGLTSILVAAGARAATAALNTAHMLALPHGAKGQAGLDLAAAEIEQAMSALITPFALLVASFFAGTYLFRVVRGNLLTGYFITFAATSALTIGLMLVFHASTTAMGATSAALSSALSAGVNAAGLLLGFLTSKVSFERSVREEPIEDDAL